MKIAIIDYGIGNLRSAEKAFLHLGLDARLTRNPDDLRQAEKIVLPGVGAFGECMEKLAAHGFIPPLLEEVRARKPLLGICVGLQMLFENSEESPGVDGLKLLPGVVRRFSGTAFAAGSELKVPQIGWNSLDIPAPHPLFAGIPQNAYVYFVHSFHVAPALPGLPLAFSDYGGPFCAAAGRGNVMGVQFHPEKSQAVGLALLKNFGTQTFP